MTTTRVSEVFLIPGAIQYLPEHHCPVCGAPGELLPNGTWYQAWQVLGPGSCALDQWRDHLVYVRFACHGGHGPYALRRMVRLGQAMLPIPFVTRQQAEALGETPDVLNAQRVAATVAFLAQEAFAQAVTGEDLLTQVIYRLVAGALSPAHAIREIRAWAQPERFALPQNGGSPHV
jgi:hypothetical protein